MKTTKGGKVMNPTDAYRKDLRKKELKRNKKERKKVREVGILKKDPETIKEQIEKLEMMKADGALDKARKHKKRQLEDTLNLVLKKRKEYEEKMRDKGEEPVMFSHLGPPRRRTAGEEDMVKHPNPEDSVYYHPTLNPTGAPPPGKPPMYKSSIGPRIPMSSADAEASSSKSEAEDGSLAVPPPPPPPPPPPHLPGSGELNSVDVFSTVHPPLAPPVPSEPTVKANTLLPLPLLPPPPPEHLRESVSGPTSLPPPPPPRVLRPTPSVPPSTDGRETNKNLTVDGIHLKESERANMVLPAPPPPPGLAPKPNNDRSEASLSENNISGLDMDNLKTMPLPPPPLPRQPPPMPHRLPIAPPLQPEMLPAGIARYTQPPLDMRHPVHVTGIRSQLPPPPPPGMVPSPMARPQFPGLPGLPGALRPGTTCIPFTPEDDLSAYKPTAPQKPSYVKSAASTVVKRPLAQHTPELTSMVPASVRVRRETAVQRTKPKPPASAPNASLSPSLAPVAAGITEAVAAPSASKGQSIDDSYMAFLDDMKALGALDN